MIKELNYKKNFLFKQLLKLEICLFFLCFMANAFSLENPCNGRLNQSTGQKKYDSVERGITFTEAENILASDHGTLLMTLDENANFPTTLGKAVIINHNDGLQTVYGNLEEITELLSDVQSGTIIGKAGESGFSAKNSLLFQVIDTIQKAKINPLLLLPITKDEFSPQLRSTQLVNSQGIAYPLTQNRSFLQGEYYVYSDSFDTIYKGSSLFPVFKSTVYLNGKEVASLSYETLTEKDGKLFLQSSENDSIENTNIRNGFTRIGKINLKQGRNIISIELSDLSGNAKTFQWIIFVN